MGTARRSLNGHDAALAIDPTQLAEIATSLSNNFQVCLLRRNGVPGVFGIGAAKSVPTDVQPWGEAMPARATCRTCTRATRPSPAR